MPVSIGRFYKRVTYYLAHLHKYNVLIFIITPVNLTVFIYLTKSLLSVSQTVSIGD